MEKKNISQENFIDIIKEKKEINKYIENKNIKKVFFVKNRLINILTDEK